MKAYRGRPIRLSGLVLPEDGPHRRAHLLAPAARTPEYLARYDRHTLFYDCVRLTDSDTVLFTAPRLLNLWPLLRDGLRLNGAPAGRLRRRVFPKYELIRLPAARGALSVVIDGASHPIVPRAPLAPRFAGHNAVMTMNRNNRLEWIEDWLTFHVRAHGLQAAVIHDNGSTAYDLDTLAGRVAAVPGLQDSAVISAPYPYGIGVKGTTGGVSPKFLQSAMMNLARVETLARARAVLNVDVDELVQGPAGASLFDAAHSTWHGTVNIGGTFAFPAPGTDGPAPQRAHVWHADPPRVSPRKWAARPDGLLSRVGWFVHQVGGEPFRLVPESRDFRLVHCAATSARWRRGDGAGTRRHDAGLQAMMDRVFDDRH